MIKTEKIVVSTTVETIIECDSCGRESEIGSMEASEYLRIDFRGGFLSIFGDGSKVSSDLCQFCIKKYLGNFLKITNNQGCNE